MGTRQLPTAARLSMQVVRVVDRAGKARAGKEVECLGAEREVQWSFKMMHL